MRLHFREYGQGAPLVVLHGLLGSHDNWHAISRRLGSRFRVLAVDQRNHGRSPHSSEMTYAVMAGDLLEFFDRHSITRAAVLGHSMGGKTAMHFALAHPERVGRLIVVDIAPRAYEAVHEEILDALLALDVIPAKSRKELDAALAARIPERAVRRFLLTNLGRDAGGALCWKPDLRSISRNYTLLSASVEASGPFDGPVLFIRGGRSHYIRDEDHAMIHRLFPRAEIRTIQAAGHWVHAEAPDALIEQIERFLETQPSH